MDEYTEAGLSDLDRECAQYLEKVFLEVLGQEVLVLPIETSTSLHFLRDREMMEFDSPHFF